MRTRTKICGITREADAVCAVESGADAIGLVFYPPSPRFVDIEMAQKICQSVGPFVSVVGLFVNADSKTIDEVCDGVPLDLLQFHGEETESECSEYGIPFIKAVRVKNADDVNQAVRKYKRSKGILVDAYVEGIPGGTGESFDWSLLPKNVSAPIILAGGLRPENIFQAIVDVRPYAVDVSGGVEQSKGIKDNEKISRFIDEVSRASEYSYN